MMIQANERVSLVAVSLLGGIGLGLVAVLVFRPADVSQLSVLLGGVVGGLCGIVSSHPRPAQTAVGSAETVEVNPPAGPVQDPQP